MSELQRNDHINLCLVRSESVSSGKKGIRDYFGKTAETAHPSVEVAPKSYFLIKDPLPSVSVPRYSNVNSKGKSVTPSSSRVSKSRPGSLIQKSKSTAIHVKTAKSQSKTAIDVPNSILVALSFSFPSSILDSKRIASKGTGHQPTFFLTCILITLRV